MRSKLLGLAVAGVLSTLTPGVAHQAALQPQITVRESRRQRLYSGGEASWRSINRGKRYSASVRQHQRHSTKAKNRAEHRAHSR